MWATGKLIEPYKASNFRDLDDVEKTHYKNGKAIGRRGENGHPHTGTSRRGGIVDALPPYHFSLRETKFLQLTIDRS
jgi:hypothetical protein